MSREPDITRVWSPNDLHRMRPSDVRAISGAVAIGNANNVALAFSRYLGSLRGGVASEVDDVVRIVAQLRTAGLWKHVSPEEFFDKNLGLNSVILGALSDALGVNYPIKKPKEAPNTKSKEVMVAHPKHFVVTSAKAKKKKSKASVRQNFTIPTPSYHTRMYFQDFSVGSSGKIGNVDLLVSNTNLRRVRVPSMTYGRAEVVSHEAQVASLTVRIADLTRLSQKRPQVVRRGLQKLVSKRSQLLEHVKRQDEERYRRLLERLGIPR